MNIIPLILFQTIVMFCSSPAQINHFECQERILKCFKDLPYYKSQDPFLFNECFK